ncbi:MAG: T9SS type A sorting domain-containing protein [Bacteroidetes bacterium]|nr:T9SS type A sorting domain-containing protein [Bacteroidota bacterium]
MLLSSSNLLLAQCQVGSSGCGGYTLNIDITPITIKPSTNNCPWGYNYNVEFKYIIKVSGVNSCYNGNIGIQPQISCSGQNNGYYTINVPAPTVGSGSTTATYTGTLTTSSNSYRNASDCGSATPSSINCNSINITTFGPGISTATYNCNVALPIQLINFGGSCRGEEKQFEWSTASEQNTAYFMIEGSNDGMNWVELYKSKAASISSTTKTYTAKIASNKMQFYRLKQTDLDEKTSYSGSIVVANCIESHILDIEQIYPNPSSGTFNIQYTQSQTENGSLELLNSLGVKIKTFDGLPNNIDLSELNNGVYILQLKTNAKTILRKLIVNR